MKISDITVLICDDSPLIRKKVTEMLKKVGVGGIYEAEDGEMAVEKYREYNPSLVLMDIVMPKKTGIDALKEIKEINGDARVVMASTIGTQKNLISAIKAGAFEFLQKPIKEEDIIKIINMMMKG